MFNRGGIVTLYKSLVRCHLEYANSVWNPHRQGLIKDLKKVHLRAIKLVLSIKYLTYKERLRKFRRIRGGMIEVFKILTGKHDSNVTFSFEKHQDIRTGGGGHNLKLINHRCHYDLKKYFLYTNN